MISKDGKDKISGGYLQMEQMEQMEQMTAGTAYQADFGFWVALMAAIVQGEEA
jgi:hypothetical protein